MHSVKQLIKILHLEDSPADAEVIQDKLASGGLNCEIIVVNNKQHFESALAEGQYDIVLADFNVPGYEGFSALQRARELQPNIPVIMISGALKEDDAILCLQFGAMDYVLKQRLERLPAAVIRALDEADADTQRRIADEALRESEERFRQLAEQSTEGFWFVELNPLRFIYWSTVAERISGISNQAILDDPNAWMTVCHPEDMPAVLQSWGIVLAARADKFEREFRVIHPDGSIRWVLLAGTGIKNPEGMIIRYGGTIKDISERKQMESHSLRTQRLESIGTLAGGVAHDLNNALAPIMMIVDLLRKKNPDSAEMLDTVYASAKRGADMVKQLLTFARGVEGERLLIQPAHILKDLRKIIISTFPKNIEVVTNFGTDLWPIQGDSTQLHQVLLNLCVNARDAMPKGGTLTLEAVNVVIDSTEASTMHGSTPGQFVLCRVIDTGLGMDPAILDRIFEPYFTTKTLDKGTGLGLSTTLGILQSHGGFIHVHSVLGQGSTFAVYLPVSGSTEGTGAPVREEAEFHGNGELILIVDDEAAIRSALRDVLMEMNFQSISASDGTEALARVAERKQDLRLVITDLHMPNMEGDAFVKVVRHMIPDVPIIVNSGRLEEREINKFKELGVHDFLYKPFSQADLIKALKGVLNQ